jgi:hypothetical protein
VTTSIEEQLRLVMRDMADEIQPSPPPLGLQPRPLLGERRRLALAAVAVVAALAAAVGSAVLLRDPRPEFIEPTIRPPKEFHLTETVAAHPGRSVVAVIPAQVPRSVGGDGNRTLQLQPAAGGPERELALSAWVDSAYSQQLSWDGSRVLRQRDTGGDPRLEIVNLETGRTSRVGGLRGYCPQLSPDNRRVAMAGTDGRLTVADARTGHVLWSGGRVAEACSTLGWSPDGQLLMVPGGSEQRVLDRDGRVVDGLGQRQGVNSGMSWSPDSHTLLLYDRNEGRYLVRDVTTGSERATTSPADALKALGWAGSRIVWLVGQPGSQRLVTTDQGGADLHLWMRIDAGDRPIETVQWSRELAGRPVSTD